MTRPWSTAFLASLAGPDERFEFIPASRAFSGQTIRQRVTLRRGGSRVRLVLSNEFGAVPLVIDAVSVGTAAGSGPVLLAGRPRWEIPAGQVAASDHLTLPVPADEIVISCFAAGSTGPATYLHSAQRSGQVAAGDQAAAAALVGAEDFGSLYWISRVLVDEPARGPVVVAFGDSITRGDGTSMDQEQRYPDQLQRRLSAGGSAVVLNAGLGGNRLLSRVVGPSMADRFDRDIPADASHVIIMGGINDILLPAMTGARGPAAAEITAALFRLAARAEARGVRPVLGTITPLGEFGGDPGEGVRLAVNHSILAQQDWAVADFAAAVADPAAPDRLAAPFDSGDGLHPNDAGAAALAAAVDASALM